MRMVILGPPGSGKSTRSKIISELYDLPIITTSTLLKEVVKENTEQGRLIQNLMQKGELVPDHIVNQIVKDKLQETVETGFILDGYPRNLSQADVLSEFLEDMNKELDNVVQVELSTDKLIERLTKRRVCPNCGATYHLDYNPPKKSGICDQCGSELIQREDDKPAIVKRRIEEYQKRTQPLIEKYSKEGKLKKISGEVELEKLPQAFEELLGKPKKID